MARDPYRAQLCCSRCPAVAYPVDAIILDATHALARFEPVCEHVTDGVWLIGAPGSDPRCQASTARGTRCKLPAMPGRATCAVHARQDTRR